MPKLMVVDDDRSTVSLLTLLLQLEGYQVVVAEARTAAFDAIRAERPDMVLLDFFLSDGEGLEVLLRLRADPELAETRVIMLSGMELSEKCYAAGADGFLLKPYTPDQLIALIREKLGPDAPAGKTPAGRSP
ncbi:MAG: hypothetical protein A2Y93_01885 [Chloroflexi bacterium RBG_13_68_17]|nr:MAG: hypothetical protein A2Y93_01885 [Chloroflexi bacterium RBG_13_68_17]